MQELYLELSGNVPGGFLLLTFILVTINLALYYLYKSSKLFDKKTYQRKSLRFNISLLTIYIFLWIYLSPPSLSDKIAYLPWQQDDRIDVAICEALQLSTETNLKEDYYLHRWEWFYETSERDSIYNKAYRARLASALDIDIYVTGNIISKQGKRIFEIIIYDDGDIESKQYEVTSYQQGLKDLIGFLEDRGWVRESSQLTSYSEDQLQLIAGTKEEFVSGEFENALNLPDSAGREIDILKARALIQLGRKDQSLKNKTNLKTVETNRKFQKSQALLLPYSKSETDNADLNVSLSRLYMHMGDFETAEICLKRAVTQNPFDSRVYFMMSLLHESRFTDLMFDDRKALLKKAISLDPGYADAVFELADEYYNSGTGTASGYSTTFARELLQNYMKINANSYPVLNLLGKIYLQTKHTLEAKSIFEKLIDLYPDSAEVNYNLGVSYFQLKDYETAENLFKEAIKIDDDLDSYLYLGAVYKLTGDEEKALEYFRERIRRKTGSDDHYAKEAMRQVRIILSAQSQDSLQVGENENKDSVAL